MSAKTSQPARPWHRQPKETARQFEAFTIYLETGGTVLETANALYGRSEKAQNLYVEAPGNVKKWAAQNQWQQRRLAYSDHLALVRDATVEAETKKQAVDWARRRLELDEEIMLVSEQMVQKAKTMMQFPIADRVTAPGKDGKPDVHFYPAKWNFSSAASLLTTAVEASDEVSRRRLGDNDSTLDDYGDLQRRLEESLEKFEKENEQKAAENGNADAGA